MNITKSMISFAAASLLAVSFTGCDSTSNDTATTSTDNDGIVTQITTPKGTITGTVMDTNGNPLKDVAVYVAGKTTTTDAGGIYTFADVPVTTTSTDGANNANAANQTLSVTIAAPTGYLGATVTVTPTAQLDHSNDDQNTTDSVANTTFVDGYLAQAGTAVLPQLNGSVSGTLRNLATGEALVGKTINLDMTFGGTTGAVAQEEVQDTAVGTTYAVSNYSATTDANGVFTFSNLPSDSDFTATSTGYGALSCAAVTTDVESGVELGNCTTTAIAALDTVSPMVKSITTQINGANTPVMLEDDTRQTIVVNFTEVIDTLSEIDKDVTSSVTVYNNTTPGYLTQTASISGDKLTIVLDSALGDNQQFDINLLVTDFKDTAGNLLTTNGAATVAYDTNVSNGQAIRLAVNTYNDLNQNAQAVTAASQLTVDSVGTKDLVNLQTANASFNDVNNSAKLDGVAATISQLNSTDVNATHRLAALGTALNSNVAVTMNTSMARVGFTTSGAATYKITAKDSLGNYKAITKESVEFEDATNTITTVADTNVSESDGTATITITPKASFASAGALEFTYNGAAPKDVLTITPMDDFGYAGTATTVSLLDNVAPTTILQRAYNSVGTMTHTGSSTVVQYGEGGELSENAGSITIGTPYLPIGPGLLDNLTSTGVAMTAAVKSDNSLTHELFNLSKKVTGSTNYEYSGTTTMTDTYDSTAWTAFTSLTRTVGVAFSENIDITGLTPSYNGAQTLTYAANNDVTADDNGSAVTADLVNVTTTDIFKLANDDNGKIINFAGIKDTAGNASATASVVVRDEMPPFITKASWNGTALELTFNETLAALSTYTSTTGENNISFNGNVNNPLYTITKDSNVTIASNVLTINELNATSSAALEAAFTATAKSYVETLYGTTSFAHTPITAEGVKDANSNTWSTANVSYSPTPKFAAVDIVPNLNYTVTGQSTSNLSFIVTFNQSLTALYDVNDSNISSSTGIYADVNASTTTAAITTAGTASYLAHMYVAFDDNTSVLIDNGSDTANDINNSDSINTLNWGLIAQDTNVTVSGATLTFSTNRTKDFAGGNPAITAAGNGAVVTNINFKASSSSDSATRQTEKAKYTKAVSVSAQ